MTLGNMLDKLRIARKLSTGRRNVIVHDDSDIIGIMNLNI